MPPGVLEIEAGYQYRRLGDGTDQSSVPFLLRLTLVEWAQLQVGSNGPTFASGPTTERYFDDVQAGLKIHLARQTAHLPSLALSAALSIPTAAATGYTRTWDALLTGYASKDVGRFHGDWNVGADVFTLGGARRWQGWSALAISTPIGGGAGGFVELYGFTDGGVLAPPDAGLRGGVTYAVRGWIVIDAGADLGLVRATHSVAGFAGVTFLPRAF